MNGFKSCPPSPHLNYRDIIRKLTPIAEEQELLQPLVSQLDYEDGKCDGYIPPLTIKDTNTITQFIGLLPLEPERQIAIANAFAHEFLPDPTADLFTKSYRDLLSVTLANPTLAEAILEDPRSKPTSFWDQELEAIINQMRLLKASGNKENYYAAYSSLLDKLYANSGLSIIDKLIDRVENNSNTAGVTPDNTLNNIHKTFAFVDEASTAKLFKKITTWPEGISLDFDPSILPLLHQHRRLAEQLFINTLNEKLGLFSNDCPKDPLLYWMPFATFTASKNASRDLLRKLYLHADKYAYDNVMKILFDVEYRESTGIPIQSSEYVSFLEKVKKEIVALTSDSIPSSSQTLHETQREKEQRYYAVLGRLWSRKYAAELSSFTPDFQAARAMEDYLRNLIRKRRDHASLNEIMAYALAVDLIATAWTGENGLMSHTFWTKGLNSSKTEIMRVAAIAKEVETVASEFMRREGTVEILREIIAGIRIKTVYDAYIRAGLSKQAVLNLDSEPAFYRETTAYQEKLAELSHKYPWLIGSDKRLHLDKVGHYGDEAYDISKSAFLVSNKTGREAGLPITLTVIGSLGGPLGSLAGGLVGKGINRFINLSDSEVEEVLEEAKATGIPLISKGIADEFNRSDNIDWFLCGFGGLATFKFSRSLLSIGRGATMASLNFVRTGGLNITLNKVKNAAISTYVNAPNLAGDISKGILNSARSAHDAIRSFSTEVAREYGSFSAINILRHLWFSHGAFIRISTGASLMLNDYLDDKKFNNWSGPLGAALIINDVYGHWIWGWDPAGGMAAFIWRYGIIVGVQAVQGGEITKPDMTYTTIGMLGSYSARGINKIWTLGRAEAHASKLIKRLALFCEKHNVIVPLSVHGRSQLKGTHGLVRGVPIRLGKEFKPPVSTYSDGHVLHVDITERVKGSYLLRVLRKATGSGGEPIIVEEVLTAPRASAIGRFFSRTIHHKLGDSMVYKISNSIIGPFTKLFPKDSRFRNWWSNLENIESTAKKPIFNLRGSLANLEILPVIAGINAFAGYFQGADPKMMGLYTAADYGIAYFFQHKVQHLFKIDSFSGVSLGYALGLPFSLGWPVSLIPLPKIFPTMINTAPGLKKEKSGYYPMLLSGNFEAANESLKSSITSVCIVKRLPLIGDIWNKYTPFGSVSNSNIRIEEAGAIAFWRQSIEIADMAEEELSRSAVLNREADTALQLRALASINDNQFKNHTIMVNFIDKVIEDAERYFRDGKLPDDPVVLRLHILELAFLKKLANSKRHPHLASYAMDAAKTIRSILNKIPNITSESNLSKFVTRLNIDELF